jgi:hypothetical protein
LACEIFVANWLNNLEFGTVLASLGIRILFVHPNNADARTNRRSVVCSSSKKNDSAVAKADQHQKDTRKSQKMIKPSRAIIAGAAVAGLLTGSFAVRAYAATTTANSKAGVALQQMDDAKGKHGCKGQNECKGQGGCKTSDNGCKAKNSCKGKGGCATDGSKPGI